MEMELEMKIEMEMEMKMKIELFPDPFKIYTATPIQLNTLPAKISNIKSDLSLATEKPGRKLKECSKEITPVSSVGYADSKMAPLRFILILIVNYLNKYLLHMSAGLPVLLKNHHCW